MKGGCHKLHGLTCAETKPQVDQAGEGGGERGCEAFLWSRQGLAQDILVTVTIKWRRELLKGPPDLPSTSGFVCSIIAAA